MEKLTYEEELARTEQAREHLKDAMACIPPDSEDVFFMLHKNYRMDQVIKHHYNGSTHDIGTMIAQAMVLYPDLEAFINQAVYLFPTVKELMHKAMAKKQAKKDGGSHE